MRLSDSLTQYIMDMLSGDGNAEIRRNELASRFGCVPSQINYVITSRFTPEQGYLVESRRGGGGYIRITRINTDPTTTLMHIVNSIGGTVDKMTAQIMISNMLSASIIDKQTASLIASAVSDRSLLEVQPPQRDIIRAAILKNMLLTYIQLRR